MVKCEALLAGGKYAEALGDARSLTVQGDAMAPEVLTFRAQALYLTGGSTCLFLLCADKASLLTHTLLCFMPFGSFGR